MYTFLDYLCVVLHSCLVGFNLIGWAWRRTRRIHLATISLTILSWFGLGIYFGWGYCPCTDWHWAIKRKLGATALPNSYIKYYLDKMTTLDWDPTLVNTMVLALGILAFVLSSWLNLRDFRTIRSGK